MSSVSSSEIKREFVKSKIGLIGIGILASLIILSMIAIITIPIDTFKQWNNPVAGFHIQRHQYQHG